MNFAWPLGQRLCRPLGQHFVRHFGARQGAAWTLAAGASAMMLAHPGVKAEDDGLTNEERRTVELFKQCSGSVVHINTFVSWRPNSSIEKETFEGHQRRREQRDLCFSGSC